MRPYWLAMKLAISIFAVIAGIATAAGQTATAPPAANHDCTRTAATARPPADPKGNNVLPCGAATMLKTGSPSELPNAPSYTPLTPKQKFQEFARTTYAPYTFFSAAYSATLAQAEGQFYDYGGGMQGWGKRFGASLADTESRKFIQSFVLSTVLHQDPRFFPSRKKGLIPRAWYAATRVFVTRSDSGLQVFNSSELLGTLFTSSLQNAYYPQDERSFGDTLARFGGAYSSDVSSYLLREFGPDMRRLFKRHAPKKIQEIEQKIPEPISNVMLPQ